MTKKKLKRKAEDYQEYLKRLCEEQHLKSFAGFIEEFLKFAGEEYTTEWLKERKDTNPAVFMRNILEEDLKIMGSQVAVTTFGTTHSKALLDQSPAMSVEELESLVSSVHYDEYKPIGGSDE